MSCYLLSEFGDLAVTTRSDSNKCDLNACSQRILRAPIHIPSHVNVDIKTVAISRLKRERQLHVQLFMRCARTFTKFTVQTKQLSHPCRKTRFGSREIIEPWGVLLSCMQRVRVGVVLAGKRIWCSRFSGIGLNVGPYPWSCIWANETEINVAL